MTHSLTEVRILVPQAQVGSMYVWASSSSIEVRASGRNVEMQLRADPRKYPHHPDVAVLLTDVEASELITSLRNARDGIGILGRLEPVTLRELLVGLEVQCIADVMERAASTITQLRACSTPDLDPSDQTIENQLMSKAAELRRTSTPTMRSES